ncbi:MAG TPA: sulfite exporter TauE/SafE family protein [Desulfotomaculum sp.]|nr:sulfite exporter TauE/SafE family protein [Desulfotomaculum sp.]
MVFPSGLEANPILILLWGIIVGYVFSTVGAAGAILAFIGQVVCFKLDKAMIKDLVSGGMAEASAKKAVKNTLKVHNLMAVVLAPIIAVPRYFKDRRVAIPLALVVAAGVVLGALVGPEIPMSLKQYKFYFGIVTFLIGVRLIYETTETYRKSKEKLKAVSKAFEEKVKELRETGKWEELRKEGFKVNRLRFRLEGLRRQ